MTFEINKNDFFTDKQKDDLNNQASNSQEQCKETFKKFGLLALIGESTSMFIRGIDMKSSDKGALYDQLFFISFLFPLVFAGYSAYSIQGTFAKLEKNFKEGKVRDVNLEKQKSPIF